MLRLVHVEEIENLLLLLPALVAQQETRSYGFIASAAAWLRSLESAFTANRLYHAGKVATLRSNILAAEQGQLPTGIEFRGRPSRSRLVSAVASQALQRAAEVATAIIAENRPRLVEAERVAQQIVAAARSRGLITDREEEASHTEHLKMLRRSFVTSSDLESAVVHLEGLVGPNDALVLLDRSMAPLPEGHSLEIQAGARRS